MNNRLVTVQFSMFTQREGDYYRHTTDMTNRQKSHTSLSCRFFCCRSCSLRKYSPVASSLST